MLSPIYIFLAYQHSSTAERRPHPLDGNTNSAFKRRYRLNRLSPSHEGEGTSPRSVFLDYGQSARLEERDAVCSVSALLSEEALEQDIARSVAQLAGGTLEVDSHRRHPSKLLSAAPRAGRRTRAAVPPPRGPCTRPASGAGSSISASGRAG